MEYGILLTIAIVVGGGVAGGLLNAWSCHRRLLALEENLKTILLAYDDRLNQLTKIVVRQDKSEAANQRWSKKKTQDEALAEALIKPNGTTDVVPVGHPWDPRTWGR